MPAAESMHHARAPLGGVLQVKDYRDSLEHRALFRFALPETGDWRTVEIPLRLGTPGWTIEGQPDLTQVVTLDFGFQPQGALADGRVYLEDKALTEPGGALDVQTAPIAQLVERLARRQWDAPGFLLRRWCTCWHRFCQHGQTNRPASSDLAACCNLAG
jgi:hypothetical protein